MIVKTLKTLCLLLISVHIIGQDINMEHIKGISSRNVGPAGMSGRVTSIDVDLSHPDRIFIGTASGGVWKSENGGISWQPIFDDQKLQAIGSIAIDQSNPDIIWAGTGEGNPRNSMNSGQGMYKSIDGGKHWKLMGLEDTRTIHRIVIDPSDPNTVYAACLGSIWGANPERGVFKTTNGGETWEKILYVDENTGCADFVVDPTNPKKLVAAMWEFGRKPWTFNSGGPGSGIYISFDGGKNWEKRSQADGLPKGDLGRIGLAIAPSKPNIIYALVEAKVNGLYKSTDGGFTWKMISEKNIGNRPFYYADIFVDPSNENRIFNFYSIVSQSDDGGRTFEAIMGYVGFSGVHPDHHAFWVHPQQPNYMIEGNDGGLNISRDGGKSWRFVENLPVGQFYHVNYDMEIPYNIMGGMQDNGSWVGPSSSWKRGGIRNSDWQEIYFGDGFDVMAKPSNNNIVYAMSQGGNVARINRITGKNTTIRPVHPEGENLRFNWDAPIAQDPFSDCGIYYGSQYVHKSTDCGDSWTIISPDLTTNDSLKQLQHLSGGLTIDDTQAENHTTIIAIEPSPVDKNVLWAGTDDGHLQLTTDGGQSWKELSGKLPGYVEGSWIPQIFASPNDAKEAFIVVNDYRRNNWDSYLYHTNNGGKSFSRIVNNESLEGYVQSFVQDPVEDNLLFAGTDYGLYLSLNKGKSWQKWNNDYPSVPTRDLKIHPREHDLIIGTFGRSLWVVDDIIALREIATDPNILSSDFHLFDAHHAYQVESYRSVTGSRFIANGMYDAPNKSSSAALRAWIHPDSIDVSKKPKIKIEIFDNQGQAIRTYSVRADSCINNIRWNMTMDGTRGPSRRPVKKDDDLPSGMDVAPGKYKVVAHFKGMKDSTIIEVLEDPRYPFDAQAFAKKKAHMDKFEKKVDLANQAFTQLQEAKKSIKSINGQSYQFVDSTATQIKDMGKDMNKQIAELEKLFMQEENLKGIQRTSENIRGYMWRTYSYLEDSNWSEGASQMAQFSEAKFDEALEEAVDEINAFFDTDWSTYEKVVTESPKDMFKERKQLEIE